jgi:hypothetical protein
MHGKGQTGFSFAKHQEIERLAQRQASIAARFLAPGARADIIDINAADGEGVDISDARYPLLPLEENGALSRPTPRIAAGIAAGLLNRGVDARVCLCERSSELRGRLQEALPEIREQTQWTGPCQILRNNSQILQWSEGADYTLVLADPNGPADAAVDVLAHLNRLSRRCDTFILVNETGIARPAGLKGDTPRTRAAKEAGERYRAHLEPRFWLETLRRRYVLQRLVPFEGRAMRGRLFLATNFFGRDRPRGYAAFESAMDGARLLDAPPGKSAHRTAPGGRGSDRQPTFGW